MTTSASTPEIAPPQITRGALFFAFFSVGLTSFGGVLPWARRMLVEQRRWMTEKEFVEALSLGQILPGPNVVNLAIMVGARFHGAVGAVLAFSGLMFAPLAILLMLATFYAEFGHLPAVQRIIGGVAAATAGLVVAMGVSMVLRQPKSISMLAITILAFAGSGVLGLPLHLVLAVLAPFAIAFAWRNRK